MFHIEKYKSPLKIKITTPVYTLKELCTYTIAIKLLVNDNEVAINTLEIPKELKIDLKKCFKEIQHYYDENSSIYDWTLYYSEENNY